MKKIARFLFGNFTILEWCLWLFSVTTIVVLFLAFGAGGTLSLIASLIGATSLIFIAKGNVVGQALTIVFSVLYGIFLSAIFTDFSTGNASQNGKMQLPPT